MVKELSTPDQAFQEFSKLNLKAQQLLAALPKGEQALSADLTHLRVLLVQLKLLRRNLANLELVESMCRDQRKDMIMLLDMAISEIVQRTEPKKVTTKTKVASKAKQVLKAATIS